MMTIPEPPRIARLPHDAKGRPVPRFVAWLDGKPDHRVASGINRKELDRANACHICGEPLDYRMAFLTGPLGFKNRSTSEGPMHRECAEYSLRACPHLAGDENTRRRDTGLSAEVHAIPGMVMARPAKMVLAISRSYVKHNEIYYQFAKPVEVVWWASGEPCEPDP